MRRASAVPRHRGRAADRDPLRPDLRLGDPLGGRRGARPRPAAGRPDGGRGGRWSSRSAPGARELDLRERAFAAWMAPRGIVAAATASAFSLSLAQAGIENADQVLPVAFVVIFSTVGGEPWSRSVGRALAAAGVRVRVWAARESERTAARARPRQRLPPCAARARRGGRARCRRGPVPRRPRRAPAQPARPRRLSAAARPVRPRR